MPANPLFGTTDPDLLQIGDGSGSDTIYGDDGGDTIHGLAGVDSLHGESGDDSVYGGGGTDWVDGADGNDRLFGGADGDYLDGGWGNDIIYGGDGEDFASAGYGTDRLYGGSGMDTFWMYDHIVNGRDFSYGGTGDDTAYFGNLARGHFDGGEDTDTLALYWFEVGQDFTRRTFIDFAGPAPVARAISDAGQAPVEVTFVNVEQLFVQTGLAADTVFGGAGNDTISVNFGANEVAAGGGDDHVTYSVYDPNLLDGGSGTDTLTVTAAPTIELDFDASGPTVIDGHGSTLTGFEKFEILGSVFGDSATLGTGADRFAGSNGNDTAYGGGGDDRLDGQRQNDDLYGDAGFDILSGGGGSDQLHGGDDGDRLIGGTGDDYLFGGAGRDTLFGGAGGDVMWGGDDRDIFRFNTLPEAAAAHNWIGDFTSGVDRLVFAQSTLDGALTSGRLTNADLSVGAVSGTHCQFLLIELGGSFQSYLFWDADGTGGRDADLLTILLGGPPIVGSDITIV